VDDPTFEQRSSMDAPGLGHNRDGPGVLDELSREAVKLCAKENAADLPSYGCLVGFTKLGSRLDQRLQH
jgi:hypothetical protein